MAYVKPMGLKSLGSAAPFLSNTGTMNEEIIEPLKIVDYSDKAIAVIGETKAHKDKLMELGGRYNPALSCGPGWVFQKTKRKPVEDFVKSFGGSKVRQLLMF